MGGGGGGGGGGREGWFLARPGRPVFSRAVCHASDKCLPVSIYCLSCVYASYVAGSVHLCVCLHLFVGGLRSVAAYHTMHRPIDR